MRINKFRMRLFFSITVSLLVPVLLCCIILFSTTENTVKQHYSDSISTTLNDNVRNIESKLDVLDSACTYLLIDLARIPAVTNQTLNIDSVDIFRATQYAFTVRSSLIVDTYSINGFKYFYLYFPKRSMLLVSKMSFFDGVYSNSLDCFAIPVNKWGVSTPYDYIINNPFIGKHMSEKNISKNYTADSYSMNDVILAANLDQAYINNLLTDSMQITPNYAIIIDRHGNIISSMNDVEIGKSIPVYNKMLETVENTTPSEYCEISFDGVDYILNREYSLANDWYYITALDVDLVTKSVSSTLDNIYLMIVGLIVVSVLITILLTRSINRPLRGLTAAMSEVKNKNFKVQLDVNSGGEFKIIYNGFNEMANEIDSLVHTITNEKNLSNETYIRLLQSEINPHMLYNSLESLYSMARINNQDEMANLVMALSRYFRISLSEGKRLVPFRDAFELANQYIIVQNIRMNYKIKFAHDIPEALMNVLTPKFLLQPIVENSFMHGFRNRRETCHLEIRAYYSEDCIIVVVEDNGIGISVSDLDYINELINNFDFEGTLPSKSYALRNINYQLKLEYGEAYGLSLESVYGEYTKVTIRIPNTSENILDEEQDG